MAPRLHVITASTRPGRVGPTVTDWVLAGAKSHGKFEVVNVDLARRIAGYPAERAPPALLCKGNYFGLVGVKPPFTHLVYPIPEEAGLGIHATVDLAGQVRFGPDVEWIKGIDYTPNPARIAAFAAAIRSYWPGLPDGALIPTYAGIRPKIVGPGAPAADFVIEGPADHGIAGLVNLFGIESPGLTAALALGETVRDLIGRAAG